MVRLSGRPHGRPSYKSEGAPTELCFPPRTLRPDRSSVAERTLAKPQRHSHCTASRPRFSEGGRLLILRMPTRIVRFRRPFRPVAPAGTRQPHRILARHAQIEPPSRAPVSEVVGGGRIAENAAFPRVQSVFPVILVPDEDHRNTTVPPRDAVFRQYGFPAREDFRFPRHVRRSQQLAHGTRQIVPAPVLLAEERFFGCEPAAMQIAHLRHGQRDAIPTAERTQRTVFLLPQARRLGAPTDVEKPASGKKNRVPRRIALRLPQDAAGMPVDADKTVLCPTGAEMEIQPLGAVPIRTDAARQSPDGSTAQRRAPQEVSEAADSRIATVFIPFEDFTASISLRGSKSFRHCRSSLSRPSAPAPLALRRISDNGRAGRIARSAAERSGAEHISASLPESARRPQNARQPQRNIANGRHRARLRSIFRSPGSRLSCRLPFGRPPTTAVPAASHGLLRKGPEPSIYPQAPRIHPTAPERTTAATEHREWRTSNPSPFPLRIPPYLTPNRPQPVSHREKTRRTSSEKKRVPTAARAKAMPPFKRPHDSDRPPVV